VMSFQQDAPSMGQRYGLSSGDISKVNRMYNCPDQYRTGSVDVAGVDENIYDKVEE
jgi:hypothetical protein